jgi:Thioredoxin-like [2Fe-2S] ferredoxin
MSKYQKTPIQPLTGEFVGWGDDRVPHRYIRLATANGDQVLKVAKSLRLQLQDLQPGIWLTVLGQERVNPATGETKIKVKQVLVTPPVQAIEKSPPALSLEPAEQLPVINDNEPPPPTQIRICQGSSCRRRGSEGICQVMQTYLDRHELTDRVEIKPVKCLHQCKAAPHAIIVEPGIEDRREKTHYRQLQNYQVQVILAKHFPIPSRVKPIEDNLLDKIGRYLQHQIELPRSSSNI